MADWYKFLKPTCAFGSAGCPDESSKADMIAPKGPDWDILRNSLVSASGSYTLDYGALKHLKWSPRRQPERVTEVSRAIRDVVDRSKLQKVLQQPAPSRALLQAQSQALGVSPGDFELHFQALSVEWWELNTALYFLFAPAIIIDGVLARSDTQLIEQRFVRGPWRDGRAFYKWLMAFGNDETIQAQQLLRVKFDNAQLHHTADMAKFQAHCDELVSNWSRIIGNSPDDPKSYV